jgi:spore maturation protein CgeB
MTIKHIAVVFPATASGPKDVAVGYLDAFRNLGLHATAVDFHTLVTLWHQTLTFRGLFERKQKTKPDKQAILERASGDVAFQAMRIFPDLVVVIDGTQVHRLAWNTWKQVSIPTALVMTECPYRDSIHGYLAEVADFAFANDRASARKFGIPYLPTACDSEAHHPRIVSSRYKTDAVFVGSGWKERIRMLEGVNWDGIDFTLIGQYPFDHGHPLAKHYHRAIVPNPEAAMFYCGSRVNMNLDRISVDYDGTETVTEAESLNPRCYELAGCGAFFVSQNGRPELEDIFGDLVPTFDTPEELEMLIRDWIPREKDREEIGRELNRIAHTEHTYRHRAIQLLEQVAL